MTLSTTADAISAINRLQDAFTAETFEHTLSVESGAIVPDLPVAIEVHNASFTWDAPPPSKEIQSKKDKKNQEKQEKKNKGKNPADESTVEKVPEERIFKVQDVSLSIPRGQLCAIVGSVGAGKSSLLQGM
jgi:ABC-type multidrug transport system fused ATPase/permease subunit